MRAGKIKFNIKLIKLKLISENFTLDLAKVLEKTLLINKVII